MCKVMEDMRERSLQEGVQIGQKKTARRMLALGKYPLEEIAALTGLSAAEVARLQAAPQAEE